MQKIVVDESVSQKQFLLAVDYLKLDNISLIEVLNIKDVYPGIPDNEIIKHLLNENSVFITTDRVAHNKALLNNKKSIYIKKDFTIKETVLKDIKLPNKNISNPKSDLQDNYKINKTDIHEKLLPESNKQLKKLRTKRRRIRNYFEGIDNIDNIDISVSKQETKFKIIIGIKIRAISNNGIKSLDASEIYIYEDQNQDQIIICYVLISLLRLCLNSISTTIYYDLNQIKGDFDSKLNTDFSELYISLKSYFNRLTFSPVNKGKNIEMVRRKLDQLSKHDSGNEIVNGDIEKINKKLTLNC